MTTIETYVMTNDKHLWLALPFLRLAQLYWPGQRFHLVGFNPPRWALPDNADFISIDDRNWAAGKWSNQLLALLDHIPQTHFILMLEDYWMNAAVNIGAIHSLYDLARNRPNVLRIDLSQDRQYNAPHVTCEVWQNIKIIETYYDAPYQMSLQAGIWNRDRLRALLVPDWSPWDVEVLGTQLLYGLGRKGGQVLGTTINPLPYVPVVRKTRPGIVNLDRFEPATRDHIRRWIEEAKNV